MSRFCFSAGCGRQTLRRGHRARVHGERQAHRAHARGHGARGRGGDSLFKESLGAERVRGGGFARRSVRRRVPRTRYGDNADGEGAGGPREGRVVRRRGQTSSRRGVAQQARRRRHHQVRRRHKEPGGFPYGQESAVKEARRAHGVRARQRSVFCRGGGDIRQDKAHRRDRTYHQNNRG